MRRGLIARSAVELPDMVLDARLARLRAAMREAHLDALLIYTNNTRTAGVSWLSGFVPYWSEALLVVLHDQPPVLVVALSFRVKGWIERVSRVAEVVHTPRIGREAARLISVGKGAVGIVDRDGCPAGVLDDLREAGLGLSWHDASALFARVRSEADPTEIMLAVRAADIARRALNRADAAGGTLGVRLAAAEREARARGAEEIYLAAAPDLDRGQRLLRIEGDAAPGRRFALRATVAYKGTWIRTTRSFGMVNPDAALERLAAAVAVLPDPGGFDGIASWLVEGCRTVQPLEPLMGSRVDDQMPPVARAIVSVQACIAIDGVPHLVAAPALTGGRGEAASLLG